MGFSVSCYDVKKIDQEKIKSSGEIFESIEDSIRSRPNIIIISTPPSSHYLSLKAAIKSDAKILMEKPLSSSLEDSQKILEIFKKNKERIWCVSNMRYHPAFIAIQKNISKLGKIYSANSFFSHKLSQMRSNSLNIFASTKDEGGVILDCVHDIDLLLKLFGKLSFINSWISSIGNEKIEAEDYANIWLLGSNNERISMNLDFLSLSKSRGIKIVGEKGTLIWESYGRKPEIASVKLLGTNGIIDTYLEKRKLSADFTYIEMLNDFINKCINLQNVKEASEVLNIALKART